MFLSLKIYIVFIVDFSVSAIFPIDFYVAWKVQINILELTVSKSRIQLRIGNLPFAVCSQFYQCRSRMCVCAALEKAMGWMRRDLIELWVYLDRLSLCLHQSYFQFITNKSPVAWA
jgi:hypothetical protein